MSKRKPPKNLRPYATPSGKKAAFADVQQPEAGELVFANIRGDIDAPHIVYSTSDTFEGKLVSVRVKADELRKWRASQTTSEAKP